MVFLTIASLMRNRCTTTGVNASLYNEKNNRMKNGTSLFAFGLASDSRQGRLFPFQVEKDLKGGEEKAFSKR